MVTKGPAVWCPQLLGEYESLRRQHEELKVEKKTTLLYISVRAEIFI